MLGFVWMNVDPLCYAMPCHAAERIYVSKRKEATESEQKENEPKIYTLKSERERLECDADGYKRTEATAAAYCVAFWIFELNVASGELYFLSLSLLALREPRYTHHISELYC